MPDLGDTLASDAAQEIVRAMVAGLVAVVGKVPGLWRRAGKRRRELIRAELERSSQALSEASSESLPTVRLRLEGVWEGRLRDLLAEDPAAARELRGVLAEIRRHSSPGVQMVQNISSSAPGATAQGAMFGNVINHSDAPRASIPVTSSLADVAAGLADVDSGEGQL
ncbi:MAG TPA: hypothetical protein VK586_10170 [Streptosporangiaceae bacterium]|nr:hypothetical protein [Streptosporangiaceae bacterium]